MADLEVEVEGERRMEKALEEGLEAGLRDSIAWLLRNGISESKDRIRVTDRLWRKEVFRNWSMQWDQSEEEAHGRITNNAPHARIVDEGLKPGSANPSVQDIIPWVDDKLSPQPVGDRNPSEWDPELIALSEEYSPGMVLTAFAIKDHLEEQGYPGIDFTGAAERYMERVGPMVIKRKIEKWMQRRVRSRLS